MPLEAPVTSATFPVSSIDRSRRAPRDAILPGYVLRRYRSARPGPTRASDVAVPGSGLMQAAPAATGPLMPRPSVSDRLDQAQDGAALPGPGNLGKSLREAERVRMGKQCAPGQIGRCVPVPHAPVAGARAAVEQHGEGHPERAGDLIEPARAHAVRTVFVFLDLLRRHAEVAAELAL